MAKRKAQNDLHPISNLAKPLNFNNDDTMISNIQPPSHNKRQLLDDSDDEFDKLIGHIEAGGKNNGVR